LQSVYDHAAFALVLALALGGVLMMGSADWQQSAGAAMVGVAGIGLAGTGVVAHRRWFTSAGWGASAENLPELQQLARALTVVGCACTLVALGSLVVDAYVRLRPLAFVLAAVTAVVVPVAFGHQHTHFVTQGGAHAAMYGIPWAMAVFLIVAGDRPAAIAAVSLGGVYVVALAVDAYPMIPMTARMHGVGSAVVALRVAWQFRRPSADSGDPSIELELTLR
jgi:hypothetical protein